MGIGRGQSPLEFIYKGIEAIIALPLSMTAIRGDNDVIWLQLSVKEANGGIGRGQSPLDFIYKRIEATTVTSFVYDCY